MKARTHTLVIGVLVCLISAGGCNSLSPAGFWKDYRHDDVTGQASDQGPRGGTRWIQWSSVSGEPYDLEAVRKFAEDHGWKYVGMESYPAAEVNQWLYRDERVFPLVFEHQGMTSNAACTKIPRAIGGALTVLRFDSGSTRMPPGSASAETAYGFVAFSADRRHMAVYHAWGEI